MILGCSLGDARYCSPSHSSEQVTVFMRVIVPDDNCDLTDANEALLIRRLGGDVVI